MKRDEGERPGRAYELGIDPGMWVPGKLISVLREQVMRASVEERRERVEAI